MLNFLNKTFNDPKDLEQMRKIHKIINKIDANKDARHANITVDKTGRPRFESAVNFMVGDNEFPYNTDRDLKDIEDFVVPPIEKLKTRPNEYPFANSLGDTPVLVSMLKPNNVRIITSVIPETYTCAFVDAAANPKEYQPNIVVYETPASFIDPGTRSQGEKLLPKVGTPIRIDLYDYGFAQNSFFKASIRSDGRADLEIDFTGCIIKTIIDRNGKCKDLTINGSPGPDDLFSGNPTKNDFLNKQKNELLAKAYVICKELGDTVQCIILLALNKLYSNVINTSTSITFTPDIVFALRCRLLGVPCLLKKMVSNSMYRTLILYTGEVDPIAQRQAVNNGVINQSISNNNDIKQALNTLIINRLFKLGSQEYTLSESGTNYIRETVIDLIDNANEALEELRAKNKEEHSYIKYEACKLKAFNLFGKSTDRANMSIKTLFPKDSDINLGFGAGFGYKLKSENETQYRGGTTERYTGGESKDHLIDDYYDLFYSYLYYIGANYVDSEFLYYLIQHPSVKEAEKYFYTTILPKIEYEDSLKTTGSYNQPDDSSEELTKLVKSDISKFLKMYTSREPYSSEPEAILIRNYDIIGSRDIQTIFNDHLKNGKDIIIPILSKSNKRIKTIPARSVKKNYKTVFTKDKKRRLIIQNMNRDINEYFDDTEVYGGKMKSVSSRGNKTRSKQNKTFRTTRRKRDN
jgi:hypothetical protein